MSPLAGLALSALLALSCRPEGGSDSGGDGGDGGTAESVAIGAVQRSEAIGTVVRVELSAPAQALSVEVEIQAAEAQADGGEPRRVPALQVEGEAWQALVLGLKPDTDYVLRAVATTAEGELSSPEREVTTGSAPGILPALSTEGDGSEAQWQGWLVTSIMSDPSFAVVVDADGDYTWWHQAPTEGHVITRALPEPDGSGILYLSKSNAADGDESDPTYVVRVSWDGTTEVSETLDMAHHDLWPLDDGTLLYLSSDPAEFEGETYRGDRLIERAPDGTEHTLWSVWDHYAPDPKLETTEGTGWTHANAIDYDPASDTVLLGMRNFDAIVLLDRATGQVQWQLGGVLSDFALAEEDRFRSQHQFQWLEDDRLLVFDNGTTDRLASRAMELVLDSQAWTATVAWEHETDPPLYCFGPGDVHRMENGDTMVTWGSSGLVDQVTAEGETRWRLIGSVGGALGYVTPVEDLQGQ